MPHPKIISYLKILGGVIASILLVIFLFAKSAFAIIGLSTTPDDFHALEQKMPVMANWLFATPWPVPTILILSLAASAAWLLWSGTRKATADEIESHPGFNEEAIIDLIKKHSKQPSSGSVDLAAIDPDGSGHAMKKKIDAQSATINAFMDQQEKALGALSDKVQKLVEFVEQRFRDLEDQFGNVDGGFAAIYHREQLDRLATEIDAEAFYLMSPQRGEIVEDWGKWNWREQQFRIKVAGWLDIADGYRMGCAERINDLSPDRVNGHWEEPDTLFVNSAAMIAYRYAVIRYENFKAEREQVDKCVKLAAYARPSMKGRAPIPINVDQ